MDTDTRRANAIGWVTFGLVVSFIAAVVAVDRSGTCWNNCVAGEDTVISFRPLGYWLAGAGASICAVLWSLALRRNASPLRMLLWGVPAVIGTGYWAAGVTLLF